MKLSAIIVAKDEEKKLPGCLDTITWVDEIVLIDSGSQDKTEEIARNSGARVFDCLEGSWSEWRNMGAEKAKGEWLFYIDADERASKKLAKEILELIKNNPNKSLYAIPRANIILGRKMKFGGWWPDYVKRLIKREDLVKWEGDLHEEPVFKGEMGHLKNNLVHLKHDDLHQMAVKSNIWSEKEARLLIEAKHPKISWWRFIRIMITELFLRLISKRGFMDGVEGVIYSIYQMWYRFIIYTKLWEMQNIRKEKS